MTHDLIERQLLTGKPQSQVLQLLGEPDERSVECYYYDVITLADCNLYECKLEVCFRETVVTSAAVSE
jgi:hypothetical protein